MFNELGPKSICERVPFTCTQRKAGRLCNTFVTMEMLEKAALDVAIESVIARLCPGCLVDELHRRVTSREQRG